MTAPEAGLTALGNKVPLPKEVDRKILEPIPNHWPNSDYEVTLICEEFTSLCPVTSQPDFGQITITFIPDKWLIESKSLKLYLGGFRNTGTFGEFAVNMILNDLIHVIEPKRMEVRGAFSARGGIRIVPVARFARPDR